MIKHTPGPWRAHEAITDGFNIHAESGGFAPLAKVKGDKRTTRPAALANARLMAASPDLLAALVAMLEHCPDVEQNDDIVNAVNLAIAAIRKATQNGL
jgi:hypothetical protein